MFNSAESEELSTEELFALALCAEDFNIDFFRDWANRMRAFDPELVDLLLALAGDARQFREMLHLAGRRLFAGDLPEPAPKWRESVGTDINLPGQRYFVVSDREAKRVLSQALSLQKNTIHMLNLIDEKLRSRQGNGLLESATRALASAALSDPAPSGRGVQAPMG